MRTTIASTISTILVLLLTALIVGPTQTEAFPLTIPTLNSLTARSTFGDLSSEQLDFSRVLEKRGAARKAKKLAKGVIAAIVIIVILVVIVALAALFFLRRRKMRAGRL